MELGFKHRKVPYESTEEQTVGAKRQSVFGVRGQGEGQERLPGGNSWHLSQDLDLGA